MRYSIIELNPPIRGIVAEIVRDSANGDNIIVSVGKEALIVKVGELLKYVQDAEEAKMEQQRKVRINEPNKEFASLNDIDD